MITTVLFDLDGTLLDTPKAIARLLVSVTADRGTLVDLDTARQTVGRPLEQAFASLLQLPPDSLAVRFAVRDYRKRFQNEVLPNAKSILYDDTVSTLERLRSEGICMCVATSKIEQTANAILEAAGIQGFFEIVAGHDSVQNGKPAPDMALYVASRLKVAPASCYVVGDSSDDMRMAVSAGMTGIGVLTGVHDSVQLKAGGASSILSSLGELQVLTAATA